MDVCVMCGAFCPEGSQVCYSCSKKWTKIPYKKECVNG